MNSAQFFDRFRRIDWLRPSVIALVTANLVPLFAVFVFHWDVFSLLFLFWMENVIVGVVNVLKMALAGVGAKDLPPYGWVLFAAAKLFLIPFFCVHYGMFTFVHGLFVVGFFDKGALHNFGGLNFALIFQLIRDNHLEWPFAALVVSHLIAFGWDYLWKGEFRHSNPMELMTQPYRRVVVMHVTIILGGLLAMALHLPEAALILLVVLKITADLWGHQNEREKAATNQIFAPATPAAGPTPSLQNVLQAAMQARAARTGQTNNRIPIGIIGIVLAFFLVFFGGMVFFVYDFVRPFVHHPRPAAFVPPAKPLPSWKPELTGIGFPETRPAGTFRGADFHANHGVLSSNVLTLSDTSSATNRAFVITFTVDEMNKMTFYFFQVTSNDVSGIPKIELVTRERNSKNTDTLTFTRGYAMRWQFGLVKKNKMPVKIYLSLPDAQKSFVAGTFNVAVKKDKTPKDPADN